MPLMSIARSNVSVRNREPASNEPLTSVSAAGPGGAASTVGFFRFRFGRNAAGGMVIMGMPEVREAGSTQLAAGSEDNPFRLPTACRPLPADPHAAIAALPGMLVPTGSAAG